jgi:type III restriction enzyme
MKAKLKQYQNKIQIYQEDYVANIVSLFNDLCQKVYFTEVLLKRSKKHSENYPIQETNNEIMMERGTRKTFNFIKTIFELRRNFGYNNFIIYISMAFIQEEINTKPEDTRFYHKLFFLANKKTLLKPYMNTRYFNCDTQLPFN